MRESWDVAVVGGGPAGLAAAIAAAEQGLSVLVLERRDFPPDKACGEGVLPPGVSALDRLGITRCLDPSQFRHFSGIRFVQEDGSAAESMLPRSGLGIRRTVLVEAMTRRARQLGTVLRHRSEVSGVERTATEAVVHTSSGKVRASLVVAADGLHSRLRRDAGLEARPGARRRFAIRQHYHVRPWADLVEVHVDRIGEAFVTPLSADSVNVNFTWQDGTISRPSPRSLVSRFPALQERLLDAPPIGPVMGAGPMSQFAVRRTADRLVLIGDAGGFIDSISADGLSIAFNSAIILGMHLPGVLTHGATRSSLEDYERAARRLFRRYSIVTNGLLWMARHPRVRTATIHYLSRHPRALSTMTATAMTMMVSAG